jgi:hypothetical protein
MWVFQGTVLIVGSAGTFAGDHAGAYGAFWGANFPEELALRRRGCAADYIPAATSFGLSGWL